MPSHNPIKKIFINNRTTVLGTLVILGTLIAYAFFPAQNFLQIITKGVIFLVLIPLIFVKFILKRNSSEFGMIPQNHRQGLFWAGIGLLSSLTVAYLLINFTSFKNDYPISEELVRSFWFFIFYELVMVNLNLICQEFFYKGFVFNVFFQKFGNWAIIIQFLIYSLPLFILTEKNLALAPSFVISLVGGWVAYKSRSFFYSYLMSLVFLIILDAYLIYLVK